MLLLLALLWGSSYLFIKVAVTEIPPLTLVATRVLIAAWFLIIIVWAKKLKIPRDGSLWRQLFIQAFFNSIGAWTLLAWGQQHVEAGLASVLNSTSPLFVFLISAALGLSVNSSWRKLLGVLVGFGGVVILIGADALEGLGREVWGQLACLAGAALYGAAALYGRRFNELGALLTATGTMLCASLVLVPLALIIDQPWMLRPSSQAIGATLILSIVCTALALLLYFRLISLIGSLGVASQAYLRAGIGVLLGMVILGETFTITMGAGLLAAILGVALIILPGST